MTQHHDDVQTEDEAHLAHHQVTAAERRRTSGRAAILPAGLGLGAGEEEVRFGHEQLRAEVGSADEGDLWGAEDEDEFAVPGAVTGSDEEREERRRRKKAGMALRGSGTRGRKEKGGGSGSMPAAPGATVGGVGGQAPGSMGVPAAAGGPAGSMPLSSLGGAAQAGKAAGTAAYSPMATYGTSGSAAGGGAFSGGASGAAGGGV